MASAPSHTTARTTARTTPWLAAAAALVLLAGLAWLLWGDRARPHEPVRVIASPPGAASVAGPASPPAAQPASAPAFIAPGNASATSAQPPLAGGTAAMPPANPSATPPANSPSQDALAAFRRAIEEAQARHNAQGASSAAPTQFRSLPEAIEAARQAQAAASAPQPAPGAGLNPFAPR